MKESDTMDNAEQTLPKFRDGDVYKWGHNDRYYAEQERLPPTHRTAEPYWCMSRFAVVRGGVLCDTFWSHKPKDITYKLGMIDLVRLGNLADYECLTSAHQYFEPEDILDLRHSNGGTVWVRRGAKQSRRIELERAQERVQAAESELAAARTLYASLLERHQ
jgi:hypothetical protein